MSNIESNYMIPYVVERTSRGERSFDIYSRLLQENIIFINSQIDDGLASVVIAQMLFLSSQDPKKDISLYINSPGGSVTAGLAIYDTMQFVKPDISTICIGMAASMAQVLLAAGTEGKRFALPHSKIMMHQPMGGTQGMASDIDIYTKEMLRTRDTLYNIIGKHTHKTFEEIKGDADRDFYMTAKEAADYKIVDKVLERSAETNLLDGSKEDKKDSK
ncbi:MAG: ATP-dependent Clp endopeptidase proteolytic subunit ClpP [Candidatus Kapaibacteriales bacterium]